ncbi:MAG: biotin transporter BioY [Alphaproteobacteria bacterium]
MSTQSRSLPPYMNVVWPTRAEPQSRLLRAVILAVVGSALLAISAHVKVPFYPVPMTLQTGVVLLIGLAYGWKLGVATVALYLVEGAVGLPVFTSGVGLAYLAGPTGGYLAGFIVAAAITGWAAERAPHWLALIAAVVVAEICIFMLGVGYLSTLIGFDAAVENGLVPFVYGDILKTAAAVALALAGRRHVQAWLARGQG